MQLQLGKRPWLFPVDVQPMRPSFKGDNKLKFETKMSPRETDNLVFIQCFDTKFNNNERIF